MNIFFKYDNKVSGKIQSEKKTHVLCMSATLILATHTSQGYSKGTHTTCFINNKMKIVFFRTRHPVHETRWVGVQGFP